MTFQEFGLFLEWRAILWCPRDARLSPTGTFHFRAVACTFRRCASPKARQLPPPTTSPPPHTPTRNSLHTHPQLPAMASPPSGYNLSKKRPSISGPLPANPSKRRKPSTGPSGLRQTSFPPEESGRAEFSRSPSVDSTYTTNTNTTRKKGRKGKGGDDDVRSTTGTSVRGGKAGGGDGADKADEEEEADQEEGGEALDAVLEGQGEADEKQEKEHLRYAPLIRLGWNRCD